MKKLSPAVAIGILIVFTCSLPLRGDAHAPLQYHGGPILRTFKIYPLYYGNWSAADITAQQNYLIGLAGYLSGNNQPAGLQPMLWQYGINEASVAPAATADPAAKPTKLARSDILSIIQTNQANGKLPAYGPTTLIMVFPAHNFGLTTCNGCGYHSSESTSSFWSVVPYDAGVGTPVAGPVPPFPATLQPVTAHEVFEAALDPAVDQSQGWDESVDGCPDGMAARGGSWIQLSFGWIPGAADNTQNGTCSTTGYTSISEYQVYGWSYADYRRRYDELWPQGWRLYILQSYVTPNGEVLYNAVWRAASVPEIQVYGWNYTEYRRKYDELWPQGWRLYILQSYVMPNGQVLYNAVWRNGSLGETQTYGSAYNPYRTQYDQLWTQKWRLQSLQSYVTNGQVLYNAVWRPGDSGEFQVYGWNYADYRRRYDELWPQGWRLYNLQSYVMPNGQVLYNAVWRPGSMPEIQVYGWNYTDYRRRYDELWTQGWRLYILDTFVAGTGQVLYNAVWRKGTIDRPL